MKIVIHDHLNRPQVIDVSRVIVYDELDNPIAATLKYGHADNGKELIATAHIGEPGGEQAFLEFLRDMGIDKTVVIVDTPQPLPVNQIKFDS